MGETFATALPTTGRDVVTRRSRRLFLHRQQGNSSKKWAQLLPFNGAPWMALSAVHPAGKVAD